MLLGRNPKPWDIILVSPPAPNSSITPSSRFRNFRFLFLNSFSFPTLPTIYIITNPNHPAPTIATSAPTTPFLLLAPVNVAAAGELCFVVDAEDVADVGGEEAADAADAEEVAVGDEEPEPVVVVVVDLEDALDPDAEVDADDSLVSLVSTALAAVTTPPSTFWGAAAFALAAADL